MTALSNIKARDIMRTDVVALTPSTSIQSAMQTFEELHISGAPVIDEYGHVVGMLSKSDVAKPELVLGDALRTEGGELGLLDSVEAEVDVDVEEDGLYEEHVFATDGRGPSTIGRTPVVDWMSCERTVAVAPDCSLATLCRAMVKAHVHRVPVMEGNKVVGIISTMDIARCLADSLSPPPLETGRRATANVRMQARPPSPATGRRTSKSRK